MEAVKCVCVGNSVVGKTSMLVAYITGSFPTFFIEQTYDSYEAKVMVDGRPVSLRVWDTPGNENWDSLRTLSYPKTDVFIVCYSVDSLCSLNKAVNKWVPEIRHHCPKAPFLLVGTKSDLRNTKSDFKNAPTSCSSVEDKGKMLGAARVMECSAKTQAGLKDVFEEAIKVALAARPEPVKTKSKCLVQ